MSITTSTNLANAALKLVAADALPALVGNLLMGNLVTRDFEPLHAHRGDPASLGAYDVSLDHHESASFRVPDISKALAFTELLKAYMQPGVAHISSRIESDLLAVSSAFTAHPTLGEPGKQIAEAVLDKAETLLFECSSSTTPKYLVVDSKTYSDIRQFQRFSEYYSSGEAGLRALVEGNVGKYRDLFIFRSRNVQPVDGVVTNLAFTKEAIGLAIRRVRPPLPGTGQFSEYAELGNFGIRVLMKYNPNSTAQEFEVAVLYGCAPLRLKSAVQIVA